MFKIRLTLPFDESGDIWLDTDKLESLSNLEWDATADRYVAELLATGHGYRGTISRVTRPLDLNKAVTESGVEFEVVEGADILNQEIQPVVLGRYY
jgi:hypothetical protein